MKFSAVLFAVGAAASTLVARQDASTIQSALESVGSATSKLGDALNSYAGTSSLASLQGASQDLIDTINKGIESIKPVGELTLASALTLQEPAQALGELVKKTSQTAIDKKQQFVADKLGPVILDQLNQIKGSADTLSKDIISKVPQAAQGIAQGLVAPINESLAKALDAYKDQEGAAGPTSGAATSAATAAPTSAAPTSAAPSKPASTPAPSKPAGTPAPPHFTGAAAANTVGFAAAALALVAAL